VELGSFWVCHYINLFSPHLSLFFFEACRSVEKGEDAAKEIKLANGGGNVEVRKIDLASFESIKAFSEDFEDEPIHYLFNNAGLGGCAKSHTKEGFDLTMGVNWSFLFFILLS